MLLGWGLGLGVGGTLSSQWHMVHGCAPACARGMCIGFCVGVCMGACTSVITGVHVLCTDRVHHFVRFFGACSCIHMVWHVHLIADDQGPFISAHHQI